MTYLFHNLAQLCWEYRTMSNTNLKYIYNDKKGHWTVSDTNPKSFVFFLADVYPLRWNRGLVEDLQTSWWIQRCEVGVNGHRHDREEREKQVPLGRRNGSHHWWWDHEAGVHEADHDLPDHPKLHRTCLGNCDSWLPDPKDQARTTTQPWWSCPRRLWTNFRE